MTQTLVPLESYRLARYSVPVACLICNEDNAFDSERCRYCHAPLALTYQCQGTNVQPKIVAVLAPARAGKTVYLGVLTDMLSRQDGDLQLVARGAFSVSLQQASIGALGSGWFPAETPREPNEWNWVHCRVGHASRWRKAQELVLPDMSGQTLQEEIEHPHRHPMLHQLLKKSVACLVLLDAGRLADGDRDPDFFAMKCISYLCELDDRRRHGWPARPFAFVFSKADIIEDAFDDPLDFCRRFAPGLSQLSAQRLSRANYFAASVAGGCAFHQTARGRVAFPFRIEPRGVAPPFEWLLKNLRK
jgi:hypothetical protein